MNVARGMFHSLGRRLPRLNGELHSEQIEAPVTIRRDQYGVPHIDASTDWDAWYALGFCQGQDRGYQLEMLARSVQGRLAEAVGVSALSIDRLTRRVGIYHVAKEQYELLDHDIQLILDAFAAGVNAGRTGGSPRQPHELTLQHIRPTLWHPVDSLAYLKFISLVISTNWAEELARYKILLEDGIAALEALEPGSVASHSITNPPGGMAGTATSHLLSDAWKIADAFALESGGSNAWAIDGTRTKTGRPILANDQHLGPSIPTHYYLAHITTPDWSVIGGTFVGSPGFFVGHNGHVAWGVTVGHLDNTDLFIEEIGHDGRSVREGDRFVPCRVRHETIRVRGADDITEEVIETPRGPIVGPALDGRPGAISMAATWLKPSKVRSAYTAHTWRSFEDVQTNVEHHPQLSLSFVYADQAGNIGWTLAGQVPERSGSGGIPLPAWDSDNLWKSRSRPNEDRLKLLNPTAGFVAHANNRPIPDADRQGLGIDWADGYRITRISELLSSRSDWDLTSTQAMQADLVSLPWREIEPILRGIEPVDDDSRAAKVFLLNWDGEVRADSSGAALFEAFLTRMLNRIAERAAPVTWRWALGQGGAPPGHRNGFVNRRVSYLIRLLKQRPEGWFTDGWERTIAHGMGDALRLVRSRAGFQQSSWRWGKIRRLSLRHNTGRGPLGHVFNRGPFPIGGDANTINAASLDPFDPFASPQSTTVIRAIIDIGNWDAAQFVLLGGQSGNPLSPHYDDQIPVWRRGELINLPWSSARVEAETKHRLVLWPKESTSS